MLRRGLSIIAVAWLLLSGAAFAEPNLVMIVHPARRAELSVDEIAQLYLRRKRYWDDGQPIQPLNLPSGTPLRAAFSRFVLRQSETRVAEYWNRQYFDGILPPATLASTEAVRRYVAAEPKAIGYIPRSEVDASVRVVLELE